MAAGTPKQTVIEIPVRGFEMDATSTVPAFRIAAYCEHARWESFKETAFIRPSEFQASVVRAAVFEYLKPLRYGDVLEIRTWLARVGNTSYDFGHQLTREGRGEVVARSRATLVQVGPNGRPAPVSSSLRHEVSEEPAPIAARWPDAPPVEPFIREWVVRPSDQDSFRHVNQAMYIAFMDDTRLLAVREGHPAGSDRSLANLSVEYIREAHAGERVRMTMWTTGEGARAFELSDPASDTRLCRGQVQLRE